MKIALAGDHAGYSVKNEVIKYLEGEGVQVQDFGTNSEDSCDYPDFIHPAASAVGKGEFDLGIFICGSANGVCMTANKYSNVRAAICWNVELAELARQHNNANGLCIPARFISLEEVMDIVKAFVGTEFEGGRHERRVNKIKITE